MTQTKKTFLAIGIALLIFVILVPFISYKNFKIAIKDKSFNHLITARELLAHQIRGYFHERFGDVDVLSKNPIIAQAFTRLSKAYSFSGLNSQQYLTAASVYRPLMEHYVTDYGYTNAFFVDADGDMIFSVKHEDFVGTNLLTGKYKFFSIGQIFKRGMEEVAFEDYTWHDELNEFTSYFAAPVNENQLLVGVVIVEIPFAHLDAMLTHRAGLGQTGEMYLVGEDGFMRSNSRFVEEPTILQQEVDTEATRDAFEGNAGVKIIDDYRGVPVLSAYTPMNLKFVDWVLLVEMDEDEALDTIRSVETKLIIIGLLTAAVTIAYIYLSNRRRREDEEYEEYEDSEEDNE